MAFVLESFFPPSKNADICFNKIKSLEMFKIESLDLYYKFLKNQNCLIYFYPWCTGLIPGNCGSSVNIWRISEKKEGKNSF